MRTRWWLVLVVASSAFGQTTSYDTYYTYDVYTGTGATGPGQTFTVTVTPDASSDWDLRVYSPSGTLLGESANGAGVAESLTYSIPDGAEFGWYDAYVYRRSGAGGCVYHAEAWGEAAPFPTEGFYLGAFYQAQPFFVALAPGDSISVDARSNSVSSMPLSVTSPSGAVVAQTEGTPDYRNALSFTVPEGGETGVYRVLVDYRSGTLGCYVRIAGAGGSLASLAGRYPAMAGLVVSLAEGEALSARVEFDGPSSAYAYLAEPNGWWVADSYIEDKTVLELNSTATAAGTYVLFVSQWAGPEGFTLAGPPAPEPPASTPTSRTAFEATLDGAGDSDALREVTLSAGQTIEVVGEGSDWSAMLCDSGWRTLASADSWTSAPLQYTVPEGTPTMTYYVAGNAFLDGARSSLRATVTGDAADTGGNVVETASARSFAGTFRESGSLQVVMRPGEALAASVTSDGVDGGWLELFSPSGRWLAYTDSWYHPAIAYTTPEDGERGAYTVRVGVYGSCRVEASVSGVSDMPEGVSAISASGFGVEPESLRQAWRLDLRRGQRVVARVGAMRTAAWRMDLWGPWYRPMPSEGDLLTNDEVAWTVPQDAPEGTYHLEVTWDPGAGGWSVAARVLDPSIAALPPLAPGDTLTGQPFEWRAEFLSEWDGDCDAYAMNLVVGRTYTIETSDIQGDSDDMSLWLLDTRGDIVAYDYSWSGRGSRIVYTPMMSGMYVLKLRAPMQGRSGTCTLRCTEE